MEPRTYFEVDVAIGSESTVATFYEGSNGQFDLRYGWNKFSSGMHDSLEDALHDFESHLTKKYPDKTVSVGSPRVISKDKALENRPGNSATEN